ncbi:MAG: hypothetical protein O7D91_13430 [Planctomycetota bacterium]|nr:hypothetical protein [Planctomycetota bacterium]
MSLRPQQKLLHYRLIEKTGQGGMGEVWLARNKKLDLDVALKMLTALGAGTEAKSNSIPPPHPPPPFSRM